MTPVDTLAMACLTLAMATVAYYIGKMITWLVHGMFLFMLVCYDIMEVFVRWIYAPIGKWRHRRITEKLAQQQQDLRNAGERRKLRYRHWIL